MEITTNSSTRVNPFELRIFRPRSREFYETVFVLELFYKHAYSNNNAFIEGWLSPRRTNVVTKTAAAAVDFLTQVNLQAVLENGGAAMVYRITGKYWRRSGVEPSCPLRDFRSVGSAASYCTLGWLVDYQVSRFTESLRRRSWL